MVVAVLGAGGQLGQALQHIAPDFPGIDFRFFTAQEIDITEQDSMLAIWDKLKPDYCINAAAYTAVDKAESEPEKAQKINVDGARNLAEICQKSQTILLHISTDFVFDGTQPTPYNESDLTHPISIYGQTKRDGEWAIAGAMQSYFIIRTSWVYSDFGHNFLKTMLRLATERSSLNVVDDQIGSPTHAIDLAKMLVTIVQTQSQAYGIYHFCNQGSTSWYGFAKKIFEAYQIEIDLRPIPTEAYPTPAKRPANSVLNCEKIKSTFKVEIPRWEEALVTYRTKKRGT